MTRAEVRIVVRDATGRPVPDANVSILEGSVPLPEISLLTNDTGVVQMFLPAGEFRFGVHGPGGIQGAAHVTSDGRTAMRSEVVVK